MPPTKVNGFAQSHEVDTKQLTPLLDGIDARTARRLTAAAGTIYLRRRDFIFKAGGPPTGLYVVLTGRVKLSLPLVNSEDRVLAILEPGTWFGDSALVLGHAHSESASMVEDTVLAHIPAATFLDCLRQDPLFAAKVLAEAFRRLHTALVDTALVSIPARERVVQWLLEEVARGNVPGDRAEIVVPATKRVLASRLNMTGAHLSRMLQELKDAKLIEVKGRRIYVPSIDRLKAGCTRQRSSRK